MLIIEETWLVDPCGPFHSQVYVTIKFHAFMTWIYLFLWIEKTVNMKTKQIHYLYRWLFHLIPMWERGKNNLKQSVIISWKGSLLFSVFLLFTCSLYSLLVSNAILIEWVNEIQTHMILLILFLLKPKNFFQHLLGCLYNMD